jgi:hypothetical protein
MATGVGYQPSAISHQPSAVNRTLDTLTKADG